MFTALNVNIEDLHVAVSCLNFVMVKVLHLNLRLCWDLCLWFNLGWEVNLGLCLDRLMARGWYLGQD